MDIIDVAELTKRYPGSVTPALDGVSFSVPSGSFTSILGRSGSGKTTLFRCLNLLQRPNAGRINIHGRNWVDLNAHELCEARRQMATIFQQFNLINRLTVLENVLAGQLSGVPFWRVVARRFPQHFLDWSLHCLDRVGLAELADRPAGRLSGGQQQRVAIARALAQRPQIILADEPVASLDPETSSEVLDELRMIAENNGITILCSLHQENLAMQYADRIIGLRSGKVMVDVARASFSAEHRVSIYL